MGKVTRNLALACMAIACHAMGALADDRECDAMATGYLLHQKAGVFRKYSAEIRGLGKDCATLTVAGTSNQTSKLVISHEPNGRRVMKLIFVDPPALGKGTVALLKGSFVDTNDDQIYYGDIFTLGETDRHDCDFDKSEDCKWKYRGGFFFEGK